jgi:hypothetical protein
MYTHKVQIFKSPVSGAISPLIPENSLFIETIIFPYILFIWFIPCSHTFSLSLSLILFHFCSGQSEYTADISVSTEGLSSFLHARGTFLLRLSSEQTYMTRKLICQCICSPCIFILAFVSMLNTWNLLEVILHESFILIIETKEIS